MGFTGSFKRRALLAVVAVVALMLIVVPTAFAGQMIISGKVVGTYYNGSKPLGDPKDVTVAIPTPGDPDTIIAQTNSLTNGQPDATGSFLMWVTFPPVQGLPTYYYDMYTIYATADSNFNNTLVQGQNVVGFDFVDQSGLSVYLKVPVKNTTVKGTVKSAKTHKPLSGVKVQVGNKSVKTSKSGSYKIAIGLWPNTSYKATFSKSHYKTVKLSFTSAPGKTKTLKTVSLKKS